MWLKFRYSKIFDTVVYLQRQTQLFNGSLALRVHFHGAFWAFVALNGVQWTQLRVLMLVFSFYSSFFSTLFSANLMITHNWLKLRKQNNFSVGVSKCVCVVLLSFFNDFDWTYCIIWQNKFKTHAHNRIKVNKSGRCIQVTAWLLRGAVGFLFDEFNNYWTQWLKFYRKNLL